MITIEITLQSRCTGCGTCKNICPEQAINMHENNEGFLEPFTDISKCIECEFCFKHCPVLMRQTINSNKMPKVYAAWSLNRQTRYNSTSGGVFTELAKAVINENGLVAGAKYNEEHLVEHAIINTVEDISLLQQSKYLQSDVRDVYVKIEKALKEKKQVLFVGTPCQCAGLKSYLNQESDNLYLCDFICRGVNSPLVYKKYLQELEQEYDSKVKQVWFKNKTNGWNNFGTKIIFENGREYFKDRDTDPFMFGYIKQNLNLYMRQCCGKCEFKGSARPVDITLGDFWGIELRGMDTEEDNGISAVLLQSGKGVSLFERIKEQIYFEEHTAQELAIGNVCLTESAVRSNGSKEFFEALRSQSFFESLNVLKVK